MHNLHVSGSVQLNILCLICINRQYLQNCIEFDNDAWVLFNFYSKYSKTRTISITHMKFNISDQRVSLPSECWREENISCKALGMIYVAVSKLGKTDLVFVQPGAKMNSVYDCENVLEQGLLQFDVSRTTTLCSSRTERHARHSPCTLSLTCVPILCLSSLKQKTGRRTVQI